MVKKSSQLNGSAKARKRGAVRRERERRVIACLNAILTPVAKAARALIKPRHRCKTVAPATLWQTQVAHLFFS